MQQTETYSPEKPWVLSHNVHDVGGNDGFVVLPSLLLTQAQQFLDHRDQEPLLVLLVHCTTDGANRPAQLQR